MTGATGYIASHIVREALLLGYRVRGTSRSTAKASLSSQTTHGDHPKYSTVVIADISSPHAFTEAIRDVDGITHVATDTSLSDDDPGLVMRTARESTVNILRAAHELPNSPVRRVVVTSSPTAAVLPRPNEVFHVGSNTRSDAPAEVVNRFLADPSATNKADLNAFLIYAASKTSAEHAAWEFMASVKPNFALNTVLPNFNIGSILPGVLPSPSAQGVIDAFHGNPPLNFPPQYHIHVRDDARIHLGALLDATVNGQRLFAFAKPFNWNDVLEILREARPEVRTIAKENIRGLGRDLRTHETKPAKQLLRKWFGQKDGMIGLRQGVRDRDR